MTDLTGKTLGNYRLLERAGRGGMAVVYKAYQPALERYVAIKVIHEQLAAESADFSRRFQREAKLVANLRHPNIVQVYDFGVAEQVPYMVMEYLEGDTLKARLTELAAQGQIMPLAETRRIFLAVTGALEYAHQQGMIHRDVKPANVFLTTHGEVVLMDFGIARLTDGTQYTASGAMVGTPAYMSPEQGQGEHGDERSDIYALGVMLYEMVTSQVPYQADTPLAVILKHISDPLPLPGALNPSLPEGVAQVIFKALAKDPSDRYPNVSDMARALEAALPATGDQPAASTAALPAHHTVTRASSATRSDQPHTTRSRRLAIGLGLIGVLIVASVAAGLLLNRSDTRPAPPPDQILFQDNFDDNQHGWQLKAKSDDYSTDEASLVAGQFRLSMTSKRDVLWQENVPDVRAADFRFSLTATLRETTAAPGDANISLIFRKDKESNFYRVRFDNNDRYIVALKQAGDWHILQDWHDSDAFHLEPDVPNRFVVLAKGNTFTIYANDQELTSFEDDTLPDAGRLDIGLGLDQAGDSLTIDFDELLITKAP
ncbi:eukaryotic-like serine/threonine-protein kinase [Thermoflexales bacterium]|nr:eukaryotic-like serine/threonine-protein kinase [Thermoflexales bacterium]